MPASNDEFLSAFRRTDQVIAAQLADGVPLSCGVAFCAPDLAGLPDANQVREVLLLDITLADAFLTVEEHFASLGRRCLRWSPSVAQPIELVGQYLEGLGWTSRRQIVFGLDHWIEEAGRRTSDAAGPSLRILPARAMRKAYRQTFLGDETIAPEADRDLLARAAGLRLDDSNYDSFVALLDDKPAGRVSLLESGDICRIQDLLVLPSIAGRGVGRGLLHHVLHLAYRLRPRIVVAAGWVETVGPTNGSSNPRNVAARALLERGGFREMGCMPVWERETPLS